MPFLFQDAHMYEVLKDQETPLSVSQEKQQVIVENVNPLAVIVPRYGRFVLFAGNHGEISVNSRRTKIKLLRHGDMIRVGTGKPLYFSDVPSGICPCCGRALKEAQTRPITSHIHTEKKQNVPFIFPKPF